MPKELAKEETKFRYYEIRPPQKIAHLALCFLEFAIESDLSAPIPQLTDEQFAELAVYVRKLGMKRIVFGTDYPLYSAEEYLEILRKRVKLTDKELKKMPNNNQ